MQCTSCSHTVTPGAEITIDAMVGGASHCPYCLELFAKGPQETTNGSQRKDDNERREMRRRARERFLSRLIESSEDKAALCPVCQAPLSDNDQRRMLSETAFRCGFCSHDLASLAYRKEAFHEQRWLPVAFALGDVADATGCRDCAYLGAMARACQSAFSWMPQASLKPQRNIAAILARTDWKMPDCDWQSCVAVKQYRKLAPEGLLLL